METKLRTISRKDKERLRALASRVALHAARPEYAKKAALWTAHNDLKTSEPLIYCDPENGWNEIFTAKDLLCEDETARGWEFALLSGIHHAEVLQDDYVVDNVMKIPYVASGTGWGVDIQRIGEGGGKAYKVKPVIEDYEDDFGKLEYPKITVDYEASDRMMDAAIDVFSGILTVERYAQWWWSLGMTCHYIDLRGFEEFLCDMILEPEWVHRMMNFLCEGALNQIDELEKQGLLFQNNGNHYVGSGGFGFTESLPKVEGRAVTPMDMWGFVESQETVSISPEMYGEFVYPYHARIAERFGMNCYGCCEPYEGRWDYAKKLHGLRRVSCSPWSDRGAMVGTLGKNYVASIKLNPSPLSRPQMDENFVRNELRAALGDAKELISEVIMKDCHTLGNCPDNARRWVEIAREEIDRAMK